MTASDFEPMNIDDLLELTEDDKTETVKTPAKVKETAAQKRIRELEDQLTAVEKEEFEAEEVAPELTADQLRIQELEAKLASALESAPPLLSPTPKGETILIHFLEDGMTAAGQIWYRGQELEFEIGGEAHEQTKDRNGYSWLALMDDVDAQWDRYGKEMFRSGPWRGKGWEAAVSEDDPAGIEKAAATERKRNRAAPVIR